MCYTNYTLNYYKVFNPVLSLYINDLHDLWTLAFLNRFYYHLCGMWVDKGSSHTCSVNPGSATEWQENIKTTSPANYLIQELLLYLTEACKYVLWYACMYNFVPLELLLVWTGVPFFRCSLCKSFIIVNSLMGPLGPAYLCFASCWFLTLSNKGMCASPRANIMVQKSSAFDHCGALDHVHWGTGPLDSFSWLAPTTKGLWMNTNPKPWCL